MTSKTLLITGVTSFTGCHIARAFVDRGYTVSATLTRRLSDYSDSLIQARLAHSGVTSFIENAAIGSESLLQAVNKLKPSVFVNHGASIKGYRRADFDVSACVASATLGMEKLFESFAKNQTAFIHTGSIFERDSERGFSAFSPYGEAKSQVWEKLLSLNLKFNLKLSKVVIPDPVGIYENLDRFSILACSKWKRDEVVEIFNPDFVSDRIPAQWLAPFYLEAAESDEEHIFRPSAFKLSNKEWALKLKAALELKLNKTDLKHSFSGTSVGSRVNLEESPELGDKAAVNDFFNSYAEWLVSVTKS